MIQVEIERAKSVVGLCLGLLMCPGFGAVAADAPGGAPAMATKAQVLACLDEQDGLGRQRAVLDEADKAHNRRLAALQAEMDALTAERARLDTRSQAAVDLWNRRHADINARGEQFNAEALQARRVEEQFQQQVTTHLQRCSALVVDAFVQRSVDRERANPNPAAADRRAQQACNDMNAAAFAGDFERAAGYAYPRLLEQLGKPKLVALLRQSLAPQAVPGMKFLGAECDLPVQVSQAGGLRLALVPVVTAAQTDKGVLKSPSHNLGISADDGGSYTFIHIPNEGNDPARLKALLPAGLGGIVLPAPQMPVMVPLTVPRPGS